MNFSASFIGTGNMGGALAAAVSRTDKNIGLYDLDDKKALALAKNIGCGTITTLEDAAKSRFLFLAVKPNVIIKVAQSLKGLISDNTVIVTMAAGISLNEICTEAVTDRCIRIMPNTPAAVGEGMILYCMGDAVTSEDEQDFLNLMQYAGTADKIDERLIDAAAALTGCGPAYVYMFAQALADGAVSCGVPREKAALYAAQTILGSAKMLQESGKHPEKLKDEVCSPGGTTIAGVMTLEKMKFRSAAASAVTAAYEKTAKLKK